MLAKIRNSLCNFMRGRYGLDTLGNFLLIIGVILAFINSFLGNTVVCLCAWLMLVIAYARMFSKKYEKRNAENVWFLERTTKIREWLNKHLARIRIRRTHHIYTCPGCKQKIKIPKGKGEVTITCPKCRIEFTKKS